MKIFKALLLIAKHPSLFKNVVKHYDWWLDKSTPEYYIKFENAIKNKETYKDVTDFYYREYININRDYKSLEEQKSKLEIELIHLKDIIEAKNLIISKLEGK